MTNKSRNRNESARQGRRVIQAAGLAALFALAACGGSQENAAESLDAGQEDAAPMSVEVFDDALAADTVEAVGRESAQAVTTTWQTVAMERGSFTLSSRRTVRYGLGSRWVTRDLSGRVNCTNAFFGTDPLVGRRKVCQVATTSPAPTPAPAPAPAPAPISTTPPNTPDVKPETIDWVWRNRIGNEALNFRNLIFDQIYATKGKLNYCVRWESTERVSAAQRDQVSQMISRQVNNWVGWLAGYDGWAYPRIDVKVVGWAVKNRNVLDWPDDGSMRVYVGDLDEGGAPKCPDACSRFEHRDGNYASCAGGPAAHFDMSLWGTQGFGGGAGGDWGQRVSSSYLLSAASRPADEALIIEHEIGHGFNLPDFYEPAQFPPTGLPPAIMQAGASARITPWDGWMLRRVWTELHRQQPARFTQ